jgi:hypothetical protein
MNVPSLTLSSINSITGIKNNSVEISTMNLSSLNENLKYNATMYLKDSQNVDSNSIPVEVEVYNPDFKTRSNIDGITITWTPSKLATSYRLLKDGNIIFEGTKTQVDDGNVLQGTSYNYELQAFDGTEYITVVNKGTTPGSLSFNTPSTIDFPEVTLGNTTKVAANVMDKEYLEYENTFELQKDYMLNIKAEDFESNSINKILIENLEIDGTNIQNKLGTTIKVVSPFTTSQTPKLILDSSILSQKEYFKWNLTKNKIHLNIPNETKIENGTREVFNTTIYFDIIYSIQ